MDKSRDFEQLAFSSVNSIKEGFIQKKRAKAKVVASVWGKEFIKFLAVIALLPRTILRNRINSSFSFKSSWSTYIVQNRPIGKTASEARN